MKMKKLAYSWNIPLEISLTIPETQKTVSKIGLSDQIGNPKNVEKSDFLGFLGFLTLSHRPKKWKLGQFLEYTPRNFPHNTRKSKTFSNIALGNQFGRPKNVKKIGEIEETDPPANMGGWRKKFFD